MHLTKKDLKQRQRSEVNCAASKSRGSLRLKEEEKEGQQENRQRGRGGGGKQVALPPLLLTNWHQLPLFTHTELLVCMCAWAFVWVTGCVLLAPSGDTALRQYQSVWGRAGFCVFVEAVF